jgi:hypothetical protein
MSYTVKGINAIYLVYMNRENKGMITKQRQKRKQRENVATTERKRTKGYCNDRERKRRSIRTCLSIKIKI